MIKNLNELRTATDTELLDCVREVKGETKRFQEIFDTDYSYTSLTDELKKRGYVQTWTKPKQTKIISIPYSKETVRMNLAMTKECKEKYEKFLNQSPCKYVHTSAALINYIDEYMEKDIQVTIEV